MTVGGSGVGGHLLRRVIDAYPEAKERVPDLRMIVVAGPRIDPESLPQHDGLEVRAYVHDLYRHLAACDLAVVQGGLTTSMELTANRRPFLYFPLRHHFEQNFHVRHRLARYGAGRCMDFETDGPSEIAAAIAEEIGREVDYRTVETDGAERAAKLIAELLYEPSVAHEQLEADQRDAEPQIRRDDGEGPEPAQSLDPGEGEALGAEHDEAEHDGDPHGELRRDDAECPEQECHKGGTAASRMEASRRAMRRSSASERCSSWATACASASEYTCASQNTTTVTATRPAMCPASCS